MYKLICIDMDGTLLEDCGEKIPAYNLEMIQKAYKSGVKIAITTGRIFPSAKYYSDLLGVSTPVIACNGAYLREKDSKEPTFKSILGKENIKAILEVVTKYNLEIFFNTSDTVITNIEVPETHLYKKMNDHENVDYHIKFATGDNLLELALEHADEILKCICFNPEDADEVLKAKAEVLKVKGIEVVSSGHNNFEIMNEGISKGSTVKRLAEMLDIESKDVICIGDGENDLSMIKYAGCGVAMGNAIPLLKENADYITDLNTNAGVGKAINKLLFENKNI